MKKKLIIILIFVLICILIGLFFILKKQNQTENVEIEEYTGQDISFYHYENRMPGVQLPGDNSKSKEEDKVTSGTLKISSDFYDKNELIKLEYLSGPNTFSEYSLNHFSHSENAISITITNIYTDKNNKSKVRLTVKDKATQTIKCLEIPLEYRVAY